jgi:hypothetical protein
MLLNYGKPVVVSSTLGGYMPNNAVDENIKTYWSAKTSNKANSFRLIWVKVSTVRAVQINYADQNADILGKADSIYHQYILYHSVDGKKWTVLAG